MRLGVAFGALALGLVVIALVAERGLSNLDHAGQRLSDRDVAGMEQLVTVSEDFLSSGYLLVRHLYVEDGDVRAQDRTAEELADVRVEADKSMKALRPLIENRAGAAKLATFEQALKRFYDRSEKAVALSRQETVDGVEERDGSRSMYTESVQPVFEQLDVTHDELEQVVLGQAAKQAEEASATAKSGQLTVLIAALLALAAAAGLAVYVTRSVTRPVAEQSSASAEQVSASTQETSASTQEIASSAAELARTAEQLDQLVRRFKVTA